MLVATVKSVMLESCSKKISKCPRKKCAVESLFVNLRPKSLYLGIFHFFRLTIRLIYSSSRSTEHWFSQSCSFGLVSFLLTLVFVLQWLSLHWEMLIMLLSQFPLTSHRFIAYLMTILVLIGMVLLSFERCSMGG